jgi:hypothetical protein
MDEVIEDNFPLKKKHVQSAPKIKHSIVPPKSKGKKVPVPSKPSTKVPSSGRIFQKKLQLINR